MSSRERITKACTVFKGRLTEKRAYVVDSLNEGYETWSGMQAFCKSSKCWKNLCKRSNQVGYTHRSQNHAAKSKTDKEAKSNQANQTAHEIKEISDKSQAGWIYLRLKSINFIYNCRVLKMYLIRDCFFHQHQEVQKGRKTWNWPRSAE